MLLAAVFSFGRFAFSPFLRKHLHFAPFCISILVANSYFLSSNYALFAPKTLLFDGHFAPFSHVFHD